MSIGENIRKLRSKYDLTQQQLGEIAGVSDKAVSTWENDSKVPRMGAVERISQHFNIPKSKILDEDYKESYLLPDAIPVTVKTLPLFTEISCGEPIFSDEDIKCYIPVGENIEADFCVIANGDSMTGARINDGDIVFIKKVNEIKNGEIAAVWVDGDGALLKRIYIQDGVMSLVSENPKYAPKIYSEERAHEVRLIGKAIAFQSNIR